MVQPLRIIEEGEPTVFFSWQSYRIGLVLYPYAHSIRKLNPAHTYLLDCSL